jgi:hypothetical protein
MSTYMIEYQINTMTTKVVQKWYKKIIVGKNDDKNKIVGSLYRFCRQYNKLNNRELDAI